MSSPRACKDEYIEKLQNDLKDEKNYQQFIERFDTNKFSPLRLYACLYRSCLNENSNDISLREYLEAYIEINKFLVSLGSAFYFVVTDINDKIGVLKRLYTSNTSSYETILKALEYEKSSNLHRQRAYASRNILRLHRALLFIYKFLERIYRSESGERSSTICSEVYDSTLGRYHTWIIRQSAKMGMYTLPKRDAFIGLMCQDEQDVKYFPIFIKKIEHVYNVTQKIYEDYQFLDLP